MTTHEKGFGARLRKMLADHERKAAAIRLTLELLHGEAAHAKTNGHATVLADAIALDQARAERKAAKRKGAAKRIVKKPRTEVLAQRQRTAEMLAMFDAEKARPISEIAEGLGVSVQRTGLAVLLTHKYLKRKGDGFVRTKKAYVVNPFGSAEA
jgi:hypothetical protein